LGWAGTSETLLMLQGYRPDAAGSVR